MATLWHYKVGDRPVGPIPFSELVELARSGRIDAEQLVRADWLDEWQRADSVVGLFYMAGRGAAQAASGRSEPLAEVPAETESLEPVAACEPDRHERRPAAGNLSVGPFGTSSPIGASRIGSTAAAAVDAQKRREAACRGVPLSERLAGVVRPTILEQALRWGCTFAAANVGAFAMLRWSEWEALRFPGTDAANQLPIFPWRGQCSPLEFAFLLGHTTLLFGALGYGIARLLQAFTDDE